MSSKNFNSVIFPSTSSILENKGYTMHQIIGQGSYALVRKAKKFGENEADVAIKIISKKKAPSDYATKFLPREIEIVQRLQHENIIRFIEHVENYSKACIVMEYAIHGDLLDYIRTAQAVSEKTACRWFHHLLDGLSYMHANEIYHRDIKCENLLLSSDYVLKITDFGFARTSQQNTNDVLQPGGKILSKTFCGSLAYAPPEVLKGIPYDMSKTDIWSSGVVLFTMTAGRLPFDDEKPKKLLQDVQKPVVFSRRRPPSDSLKWFLSLIFKPATERAYFPVLRNHSWYKENFHPDFDGEPQKKVEIKNSGAKILMEHTSIVDIVEIDNKDEPVIVL